MLLDKVICANIEDVLTIPLKLAPSFDVLMFGDVLEHLLDPWLVLSELRQYIEPGGSCVVCILLRSHSLDHRELEFSGLLTSTGWLR